MLGGAGWMAFGAAILFEALRMDRFEQMGATLYTMPGFVPGMIGATIILLGLLLAVRGWRRQQAVALTFADAGAKPVDGLADAAATAEVEPTPPLLNQRTVATLVLSLTYAVLLIGRVHFVVATTLFVGAFVWFFTPPEASTQRRAAFAVLGGVITALVVYFVFQDVFLVRLP